MKEKLKIREYEIVYETTVNAIEWIMPLIFSILFFAVSIHVTSLASDPSINGPEGILILVVLGIIILWLITVILIVTAIDNGIKFANQEGGSIVTEKASFIGSLKEIKEIEHPKIKEVKPKIRIIYKKESI